jgi:hypothetical protein
MAVLAVVSWILFGVGNYIAVYGNPGFFWIIVASLNMLPIILTILALGLFLMNKISEGSLF